MALISGPATRSSRVAAGGATLIDASGDTLTLAVRQSDAWANTRMLHHFYTRFLPSLPTDEAAAVLVRLREAAGNTEEMRRIVSELAEEINTQIGKAAENAFKIGDDATELATSSLEMMIKRSVGGAILGFKSAAEMQAGFRRWCDDMKDLLPADKLVPEEFITHQRLNNAIQSGTIVEPQLQLSYRRWVAGRVRKAPGDLSIEDLAAYPATDYMRIVRRSNRLKAMSDAILGPVVKTVNDVISGPAKAGKGWAFFPRTVRNEDDVMQELLGAGWRSNPNFSNSSKRAGGIRDALASRISGDLGAWQRKIDAAWSARYGQPVPPEVAQWINNCLLNSINPRLVGQAPAQALGGLTGGHLKHVMGNQIIDLDELAHRLVDAQEFVEDIGETVAFDSGRISARNSSGVYAQIPGQFDQVSKVVTRSSNGAHGYVHEVVTSIYRQEKWVGINLARSLIAGLRVRNIRGQLAEGFDLLRRQGNKLFAEELKAVDDIVPYLGRTENGKLTKLGSIYEQLGKKFRGVLDDSAEPFTDGGLPKVRYVNDAGEEMVDELQLETFATFSESRARRSMSYTHIDVADLYAKIQGDMARGSAACDVADALFANKSPLTDAVRDEILDTAEPALRKLLEPVFSSADPALTAAEAMWLRILVHSSEKAVPAKVIGYARRLAAHADTLTLKPSFLQGDVVPAVGVGWWNDPKNLEGIGMQRP